MVLEQRWELSNLLIWSKHMKDAEMCTFPKAGSLQWLNGVWGGGGETEGRTAQCCFSDVIFSVKAEQPCLCDKHWPQLSKTDNTTNLFKMIVSAFDSILPH